MVPCIAGTEIKIIQMYFFWKAYHNVVEQWKEFSQKSAAHMNGLFFF